MSWIRIDDQIAHHPKFLKAGPVASWLWVCCLGYCQTYLTDGFIPAAAISSISALTDPQQYVDILVAARLLDAIEGGYQVHDYLDFNDPATTVRDKRKMLADRKARWRANRLGTRTPYDSGDAKGTRTPHDSGDAEGTGTSRARGTHPIPSHPSTGVISTNGVVSTSSVLVKDREREKHNSTSVRTHLNGVGVSLSPDPFVNEDITERAGRFIERYGALYREHRKGARYAVRPARDYAAAVQLCSTWADDARLEKLAIIFLNSNHKFAEEGSRTIPQFLALASWCDGRLAEHEAKQGKRK